MKTTILFLVSLLFIISIHGQEIINLPHEGPDNIQWVGGEKAFFSKIWNTEVVCNVSTPSMEVFRSDASIANGTSVIIAPGGGLYALSIESEGNMVARWLNEKGITAFVLKYRLVPTGENGVKDLNETSSNNVDEFKKVVASVMPYSVADGLAAVQYVREHAGEFGIDKNKIGFMGFSAGGAVTQGVTYKGKGENRPDFVVPVYSWTSAMPVQKAPENPPLMLVICASDDPLGLAKGSIELYNSWLAADQKPELHMYSKGGHGFGMKTQDLPSDRWIGRFYDWGVAENIIAPNK
ncbi:alpha/beta hydrolase [uncultured Muriicola sp.]|uniref:alpha/beta hydrolase n=1 Tax=uncultured Muriicola sp. TaxID=1583102 RepID=UPI00261B80AE|nr:alpha/beta hydrolase [uncultured Muriicola sp.]